MNEVINFIKRRFPQDSNWTCGNCYYFSRILQDRFGGQIYYDLIEGHFFLKLNNLYYDYNGFYCPIAPVDWVEYQQYDKTHAKRIIRDTIL